MKTLTVPILLLAGLMAIHAEDPSTVQADRKFLLDLERAEHQKAAAPQGTASPLARAADVPSAARESNTRVSPIPVPKKPISAKPVVPVTATASKSNSATGPMDATGSASVNSPSPNQNRVARQAQERAASSVASRNTAASSETAALPAQRPRLLISANPEPREIAEEPEKKTPDRGRTVERVTSRAPDAVSTKVYRGRLVVSEVPSTSTDRETTPVRAGGTRTPSISSATQPTGTAVRPPRAVAVPRTTITRTEVSPERDEDNGFLHRLFHHRDRSTEED